MSGWRVPYRFRVVPTYFVDPSTGVGVNSDGAIVKARIGGRRKHPDLNDLLETAWHEGAERVFVCGTPTPTPAGGRHWLMAETPDWKADAKRGHYIRGERAPVGRFERRADHYKVQVHTADEWFGTMAIPPTVAREALDLVRSLLRDKAIKGKARERGFDHLGLSPTATGQQLWVATLPENFEMTHLPDEMAQIFRATSGQHRVEHLVAGEGACDCGDCVPMITAKQIDRFTYVDGRFMYASLCRELGVAGGVWLKGDEATELLARDPYTRGRFLIEFTVPDGWDHLGLAPVPYKEGWHYPNRPGSTHRAWVDAQEIDLMLRWFGSWDHVKVLEGIGLSKVLPDGRTAARPLDNFAAAIIRARAAAADLDVDEVTRSAVSGALRAILLTTIGGFHSLGRDATVIVDSWDEVPEEFKPDAQQFGDKLVYTRPFDAASPGLQRFFHPEWSAQIWARERARVLDGPTAKWVAPTGSVRDRWGALYLPPDSLIGINGDAVYTTEIPQAVLPDALGGGDDGREGRLRLKGIVTGPLKPPATITARNRLREMAELAGVPEGVEATIA